MALYTASLRLYFATAERISSRMPYQPQRELTGDDLVALRDPEPDREGPVLAHRVLREVVRRIQGDQQPGLADTGTAVREEVPACALGERVRCFLAE